MKLSRLITLLICISLPLVIGAISGIATAGNIATWYALLNKPVFSPPNFLFGPVWTLLYFLMGISLFLIWVSPPVLIRTRALWIFGIQLILNFSWSFIFFYFKQPGWAFAEIILIWISILVMILHFFRINRTAAYLQIPYLLWVSFAGALNAGVWILN